METIWTQGIEVIILLFWLKYCCPNYVFYFICIIIYIVYNIIQGVPKKHGNSVANSISSLLWISIVIPNFNSHNIIIISARIYFMKRVKDCKDVSIILRKIYSEDGQVYSVCIYSNFLVLLSTTVCSQNINKQNVNIQGVPRNMTFNKSLFLVKQIFCFIIFYFESNFNIAWLPYNNFIDLWYQTT